MRVELEGLAPVTAQGPGGIGCCLQIGIAPSRNFGNFPCPRVECFYVSCFCWLEPGRGGGGRGGDARDASSLKSVVSSQVFFGPYVRWPLYIGALLATVACQRTTIN